MDFFIGYIIGLTVGILLILIIIRVRNSHIKDDLEPMGIGTLYIYEGPDRDRYSFAFDCPLDRVGQFKRVTLDIKKRREKSLEELEHDLFAEDFNSNMDNI